MNNRLKDAVDSIPVPDGLEQRVLHQLRRQAQPKPAERRIRLLYPLAAAAVAAAACVAVLVVSMAGHRTTLPVNSVPAEDVLPASDFAIATQPGGVLSSLPDRSSPATSTMRNVSAGDGLSTADNTQQLAHIPQRLLDTTVRFADWGEASADRYQLVVKKFTEDTGIRVEMQRYDETTFVQQVARQIAAGNAPDIAACNGTFPQALELVQPLPSIFNIHDGFWDERVSEATAVGGRHYFVNSYNSPFTGGYVVYYNKRLYNNYGLTSPEDYYKRGEWTYENLYRCMQDAVHYGYRGGITEGLLLAEQMGVSLLSYDRSTGTFTGTATETGLIEPMEYMAQAVKDGLSGGYSIQSFADGRVGICMAGTYGLKYNGYFQGLSQTDIGVVPLPDTYNSIRLGYMPVGYRGYGICKGAENPDGAYYFLRYFLDMDKYADAGADIFANKVLEKYYRQTQLPLFQQSTLCFEYYAGVLRLTDSSWDGSQWQTVRRGAPDTIAAALAAQQAGVDEAARLATALVRAQAAQA